MAEPSTSDTRYILGMRVSVKHPAKSTRTGTKEDGSEWSQEMAHDGGYIHNTTGRDLDKIPVFLGPDADNGDRPVVVIDQHDPDSGSFAKHRVMLGFEDAGDAMDAYHQNYPEDWNGLGGVREMPLKDFKKWAFGTGRRVKPAMALKRGGRVGFDDGGSVGGDGDGAASGDSAGIGPGDAGIGVSDGVVGDTSANGAAPGIGVGEGLGDMAGVSGEGTIGNIGDSAAVAEGSVSTGSSGIGNSGNAPSSVMGISPSVIGMISNLAGLPSQIGNIASVIANPTENNISNNMAAVTINGMISAMGIPGIIGNAVSMATTGQSIGQNIASIDGVPAADVPADPSGGAGGQPSGSTSGGTTGTPTMNAGDGQNASEWLGGLGYNNWGTGQGYRRYSLKNGGHVGALVQANRAKTGALGMAR